MGSDIDVTTSNADILSYHYQKIAQKYDKGLAAKFLSELDKNETIELRLSGFLDVDSKLGSAVINNIQIKDPTFAFELFYTYQNDGGVQGISELIKNYLLGINNSYNILKSQDITDVENLTVSYKVGVTPEIVEDYLANSFAYNFFKTFMDKKPTTTNDFKNSFIVNRTLAALTAPGQLTDASKKLSIENKNLVDFLEQNNITVYSDELLELQKLLVDKFNYDIAVTWKIRSNLNSVYNGLSIGYFDPLQNIDEYGKILKFSSGDRTLYSLMIGGGNVEPLVVKSKDLLTSYNSDADELQRRILWFKDKNEFSKYTASRRTLNLLYNLNPFGSLYNMAYFSGVNQPKFDIPMTSINLFGTPSFRTGYIISSTDPTELNFNENTLQFTNRPFSVAATYVCYFALGITLGAISYWVFVKKTKYKVKKQKGGVK
ncbi:hypothetical protein SCLARK_00552 [Spiroplasma clarkii]|uniref:Transmembrane protein n=1 Tax=Spiroplasma clarkii TaxID=2139 RepID=A0A1Y0KZP6_9MOLU|nr:hypothetical protein [Spiroplasma clarkii]ARU91234.1 hypothetical protein SCLARK_00552 [Spiroplasma clarkii]ATX70673.1 hypothetical protein SCLAR_v1c03430 [Spiroplasma clarkii]